MTATQDNGHTPDRDVVAAGSVDTVFHDLDAYVALPRIDGLAVSPDGSRVVTAVASLDATKTAYVTGLWEVDPTGARPAHRLTRSATGESSPVFLPNGDLLFVSARPCPDDENAEEAPAMLWRLPALGGEARVIARRPGGVSGPVVARDLGTVVVSSMTFPSSADDESDANRRKDRKEHKVSAILHTQYPVRRWDHDLGPDLPRLFVAETEAVSPPDVADHDPTGHQLGDGHEPQLNLRDLTPDAGTALVEASYDITPDGTTVITEWTTYVRGRVKKALVAIDVATSERRWLAADDNFEFVDPVISPDGSTVAAQRVSIATPTEPPDARLVLVSLADGSIRELADGWDRWPNEHRWTSDGSALIVTADDDGRGPMLRIEVGSGTVSPLTSGDDVYSNIVVPLDGAAVYALASSHLAPPRPVRIDSSATQQQPVWLPAPAPPQLPGTLTELSTTAADGARVRAWLALPDGAAPDEPAPLVLWVNGGPLASANTWSWRWCPWLLVAAGYAVLMPDPALSTGYGRDFIERGWGRWGETPFTDLMEITNAAVSRDDIDADRTAAMGGSFGGYMANWIAGHTDRFRAIVTHAGMWALDQFGGTTDDAYAWSREMTADMAAANSPHSNVAAITTPMLVVHGDKDYRVPIGEALRLWGDLMSTVSNSDSLRHSFLYFPDENHWIVTPQHAKVWYLTVLAFLAHHVLGEEWEIPEILC